MLSASHSGRSHLLPAGLCHRCDTPPCLNPDHLFLGTHRDNMADRSTKYRARAVGAADDLPKGLPFSRQPAPSDILRIVFGGEEIVTRVLRVRPHDARDDRRR